MRKSKGFTSPFDQGARQGHSFDAPRPDIYNPHAMKDDASRAGQEVLPPDEDHELEQSRMSFGDHLEELRSSLIRALFGVALGTVVAFVFGRDILRVIIHPLLVVQLANGLPPILQVLSPTGAFSMYMKISFLTGLIVAMPWVLHQVWVFVATGLYRRERRFVKLVIPTSMGLFAAGVVFLYLLVLPIVLHFFIRFNESFGVTDVSPGWITGLVVPREAPPVQTVNAGPMTQTRIVTEDPRDAKAGDHWLNTTTQRLVVKTPSGVMSTPMQAGESISTMHSQFALDEYVSFVLMLALGFGMAFETPIVVYFLARTGIVAVEEMRRSRRIVLFATVVIGALLPPPDIFSQLLLAAPMYLLFEVGLLAARFAENRSSAAV